MSVRHAVVLVGGRGTRLWPLTAELPKALVPVAGVPFIEYQLGPLAAAGVEQCWLAVGTDHLDAWEEYVAGWDGAPALELSVEEEPLDTAGPVMMLLSLLDDRFLVLNGDVVFDAPLTGFLDQAPVTGMAIALARVADPSSYGVVVVDEHRRVRRFVEKPAPGTAPADTVNAGIYLAERRALEQFEPGPLSFERRVFPDLAAQKDLGAAVIEGAWLDIGTPELFLDTHERLLTGRTALGGDSQPHGMGTGAVVDGDRRGAWSWVGADASVEQEATLREAVVLDGAVVRSGATVENAVVGWGTEVGAGTLVSGHTLVGRDCVIGEGCELIGGMRVASGTVLGPRGISFTPPS
jgi:mannose-1-phosphate guanylyltransferase